MGTQESSGPGSKGTSSALDEIAGKYQGLQAIGTEVVGKRKQLANTEVKKARELVVKSSFKKINHSNTHLTLP